MRQKLVLFLTICFTLVFLTASPILAQQLSEEKEAKEKCSRKQRRNERKGRKR